MKKIIPVLALTLLLFGTIALASVTDYTETLPTFGHKELAKNQKTTTQQYAYHTSNTFGILYKCWLDSQLTNGSSSWTLVSDDFYGGGLPQIPPANTVTVHYELVPSVGKNVRLRSQKPEGEVFGGQTVSGTMDFR